MLIFTIAIYVALSVTGVVLVRMGSTKNPLELSVKNGVFGLSADFITIAGLACYVISFLIYMSLISRLDLSFIVPISTGCVYLLTLFASVAVLKEKLTVTGVVGSALILAGVLLVGLKK